MLLSCVSSLATLSDDISSGPVHPLPHPGVLTQAVTVIHGVHQAVAIALLDVAPFLRLVVAEATTLLARTIVVTVIVIMIDVIGIAREALTTEIGR